MDFRFGFIGCGNMGGALLEAVAKRVEGEKIFICDYDEKKTARYAQTLGVHVTTAEDIVGTCDYIFLGVKPQMLEDLLVGLSSILKNRVSAPVLVSMAAGISIAAVEKMTGVDCPVIRIMPNMPVAVGEGMILYDANKKADREGTETFCDALGAAGRLDRLPERLIDAASAVSGCGPAFVFLFAEALADGAVKCGLPREKARTYAAQTLVGAGKMLLETGRHEGELKDAVCSPGGTTIAGVEALESGAFRASAMQAVIAAYERTLELKK